MSIDEAIEKESKIAKENQKIVDTQIVFDNVSISELYCDDTEVIEEHLSNYKKCAEYHEQIAEWLEELKILKSLKNCSFMTIGKTVEQFEQEIICRAIDGFTEKIKANISESLIWGMIADCFKYKNMNDTSDKIVDYVINTANEIAEQLKAGGK